LASGPLGAYLWEPRPGWGWRLVLAPLELLEAPYRAAAFLHRELYARGVWSRIELPARVVSIGNLTVGGSGKTPIAGWLAAELRARGSRVALLSRGVQARRAAEVNVVSDGERILLGPVDAGDEPVWLAQTTRGVPVLAGRNRAALGLRATSLFGSEVLILDDGFQHHRLRRDVDLVCVDHGLGLGNGHALPRGPLRESPRALRRADAILLTRIPASKDGAGEGGASAVPAGLPPYLPRFGMRIVPSALSRLDSPGNAPLASLVGARVGVLCAIARPDRLARLLRELGAVVERVVAYPDHHLYQPRDLRGLDRNLRWITTAKDAVKLPAAWLSPLSVEILEERVEPVEGNALLDWLVERLARAPKRAGAI